MSGIEIAGLVLATIPLLVASLEHYQRVAGPLKIFYQFRNELSSAIRQLESEHVLFEQAIHLLLRPITMEEELKEMMADTNSTLWQDSDICEDMQRSLGRAYPSYMRTVSDIQRIMVEIATRLEDVHGVKPIQQNGLKALIGQVRMEALVNHSSTDVGLSRRFKFTMRRSRIRNLLKELRECIATLDKLQDKAGKIAATTENLRGTRRSNTRLHAPQIQNNAHRLYEVLSKAWCSDHPSHSTGLLLESRLIKRPWKGKGGGQQLQSALSDGERNCFQLAVLQSSLLLPKKWLDFQVSVMESSNARVNNGSQGMYMHNPTGTPSQLQIVTDICSTLQGCPNPCAGFYLDSDGNLRGTYDAQQNIAYADELTRLDDILRTKPGAISQQESYCLAIILAASLMHLSHTPWLSFPLDKTDIAFLRVKGCASSGSVDVKHPYLIREHHKSAPPTPVESSQPKDAYRLVALGVMLLEIYARLPIERLEGLTASGTPPMQAASVYHWLVDKESRGDLTFAFAKAAKYCLQFYKEPDEQLLEPAFSVGIETNVLKPLEEELHVLVHGPWGI